MKNKLTGIMLVDIVMCLEVGRIMRIGPKATRKKRVKNFLKEFNNN